MDKRLPELGPALDDTLRYLRDFLLEQPQFSTFSSNLYSLNEEWEELGKLNAWVLVYPALCDSTDAAVSVLRLSI